MPVSKTFCVLPWIHVSTKTNGEMRLCCTTCASSAGKNNDKRFGGKLGVNREDDGMPANLNRTPLPEGWNNSYMRQVRMQMLKGEVPVSCAKCFKEEASGVGSKRNWETEYWSRRIDFDKLIGDTDDDGRVPDKVYYLDLRLGHKCNLKCSMCSPHDSGRWVKDWDSIYPQIENSRLKELMSWEGRGRAEGASYDWYKNPKFWQDLYSQIPHLRQIYFAGGEPMLIREHFELLRECIRRGEAHRIELRYNSNGTFLPDELFELWEKFKRVRFGFSLDSYAHENHYIRYPAKWATIMRNLRRLDSTPQHIEVTLACAVQALNVHTLPEFIKWKLSAGFKKINNWPLGAGMINFHFVYHPAFLNVKVLPQQTKDKITDHYCRFFDWLKSEYRNDDDFLNHPYGIKRFQNMLKFMHSEDWSQRMPEFREYIRLLDKKRHTRFDMCFPELHRSLDEESPYPRFGGRAKTTAKLDKIMASKEPPTNQISSNS